MIAVLLSVAMERPWLGLELHYSADQEGAVVAKARGPSREIPTGTVLRTISSEHGTHQFTALDFLTEPDGSLGTYGAYRHFLDQQDALSQVLRGPSVQLSSKDEKTWLITPAKGRPVTSFPVEFWVHLIVGLFAWAIAAGVWVFRPKELSARILLLSGFSTLIFAPFAGVYTTRELAIGGSLFRWLSDLNFLGGSLFAASMVALLLCYPRRLAPSWAAIAVILVHVGWWVLQQVGVFESMILARRLLVGISLLATLILAWLQWRQTRRDPLGRASLRWFLLSWILGSGLFGFLILMPQMFGIDTSALQGYGFLLFLFVYGGLALGILRFRLFGLDEWWGLIITWLATLLVLVALDLIFLFKLHWSNSVSLSISVAICGLLWLPIRGYLSSRLLRSKAQDQTRIFKQLLDIGLADTVTRNALWQECLNARFRPLHIRAEKGVVDEPKLDNDGLALLIPAVGSIPALRLEYARDGTALFTPREAASASEMTEVIRYIISSRNAHDNGVQSERSRIARDIHDNLGAQILSALQAKNEEHRTELLRGMLTDLRGIVNDAYRGETATIDTLSELRFEIGERLAAYGIKLSWHVDDSVETCEVSPKVRAAASPLLREATNNVLKHAAATEVCVSLEISEPNLIIQVADNGNGFDTSSKTNGHGLVSMSDRVTQLGGTLTYSLPEEGKGTCLTFAIPHHPAEAAPCTPSLS